jgi:hypothetical protein
MTQGEKDLIEKAIKLLTNPPIEEKLMYDHRTGITGRGVVFVSMEHIATVVNQLLTDMENEATDEQKSTT